MDDLINGWIEKLGKRYYMDYSVLTTVFIDSKSRLEILILQGLPTLSFYRGQELSESLSYAIITIFTIIGIVAGYHYQQMYYRVDI